MEIHSTVKQHSGFSMDEKKIILVLTFLALAIVSYRSKVKGAKKNVYPKWLKIWSFIFMTIGAALMLYDMFRT